MYRTIMVSVFLICTAFVIAYEQAPLYNTVFPNKAVSSQKSLDDLIFIKTSANTRDLDSNFKAALIEMLNETCYHI